MEWRSRKAAVGAGIGLGVIVFAFALTPIVVRRKLAAVGSARHLKIDVRTIRPALTGIALRGVHIESLSGNAAVLDWEEVDIALSITGRPKSIEARGGQIALIGDEDAVQKSFQSEKSEHSEASTSSLSISAAKVDATWTHPKGRLRVRHGDVLRNENGWSLSAGEVQIVGNESNESTGHAGLKVEIAEANVRISGRSIDEASAESVQIVATEGPSHHAALETPKVGNSESPPSAEKTSRVYASLSRLGNIVRIALKKDALLKVKGLSFVWSGQESIAIGPGPLEVLQENESTRLVFSSQKQEGRTPLTLNLVIPPETREVSLHLEGGPIPFSLLGLRDGMMGLSDTKRATLRGKGDFKLTPDALVFDTDVAAESVGITSKRISNENVSGLSVGFRAKGAWSTPSRLRIDDAEGSFGAFRVGVRGTFDTEPDLRANMTFEILQVSCDALLHSIPKGLVPTLFPAKLSGTFGATGRIAFDGGHLDDLSLDYRIDDKCRFVEVPESLSRERFTKTFTHRIYHPDGTVGEESTGPGTKKWTELDEISPFMQAAVLTTEDGAFRRHQGFNHRAIRDSIVANLRAKRFIRGASTISMQLAKNLFLSRDKMLSRKLEEVVLTDYLEQVFSKDDMMELYLNIIEFGPDIYGITEAAAYYFGRRPEELTFAECMFLATLLPSPTKLAHVRDKGELPAYYTKRIADLMRAAQKTGKVSPEELAEGLGQSVVFLKPGATPPTPRPPVRGTKFEGGEEWKALE